MTVTSPQEKPRPAVFLERHSFWLGLAVVALALAAGAALSWRKWPDLIIDYGIQLYLPWRISAGAMLYRDLFYFSGGPFSQYYHALLFKLFGVSILTLVISNLVIVAALLFVMYRRFRQAADTWTATIIGLGVVAVFVFGQYGTVTNYTYLAPYSHEALHGLFFSVLAVAWLSDWLLTGRLRYSLAAGFCAGLVFLTKPDIFLALIVCSGAAFFLQAGILKRLAAAGRSAAAFIAAGMLPVLGFFLFFLRDASWGDSLLWVTFGWRPVFTPGVVKSPFYQWCLGLDAPQIHVRHIIGQSLCVALAISLPALALWGIIRWKPAWRWPVFLALVLPLGFAAIRFDWINGGYSLPLFCVLSCLVLRRDFETVASRPAAAFPLLWGVFGIVLLLKMGFFPRLWHYGFVLAMPAFAGAVFFLLWRLPLWLAQQWQVPACSFRALVAVVLIIGFVSLSRTSVQAYAAKNIVVGTGDDRIIASERGVNGVEARNMKVAVDWIARNIPTNATLAVLPEGTLINFLTRRFNPSPDLDWNPTMFPFFSQDRMTAAMEKARPDYVCVVEWTSFDFGVGYFGQDGGYGTDLMRWIKANYTPVFLTGSEPLKNGLFGIKILKRAVAESGDHQPNPKSDEGGKG